jgi:hypothetical protein
MPALRPNEAYELDSFPVPTRGHDHPIKVSVCDPNFSSV